MSEEILGSILENIEKTNFSIEIIYKEINSIKSNIESDNYKNKSSLSIAKQDYSNRRKREKIFKEFDLFGEPAWDMLVDLYISYKENRKISVSSLCLAAIVPSTTALRWIVVLEKADLIARSLDSSDRRKVYISLTERAKNFMEEYFKHNV